MSFWPSQFPAMEPLSTSNEPLPADWVKEFASERNGLEITEANKEQFGMRIPKHQSTFIKQVLHAWSWPSEESPIAPFKNNQDDIL